MKRAHQISKYFLIATVASCGFLLTAVLLPADSMAGRKGGGKTPTCDSSYPTDRFHACFYSGSYSEPASGVYLGGEDEPSVNSAVLDRAFGVDRDWGTGAIFGGRYGDVSAVWRGRLYLSSGNYLFTLISSGGVRVFVDDVNVLDEWENTQAQGNFVADLRDLQDGLYDIRIEWYSGPQRSLVHPRLEFYWDKAWDVSTAVPSVIDINFYIVTSQETCIIGDPLYPGYDPEKQLRIRKSSDKSDVMIWQVEDAVNPPSAIKRSDLAGSTYTQFECFTFQLKTDPDLNFDEIEMARREINSFVAEVKRLSFDQIEPRVHIIEISGDFAMGRSGKLLRLAWPQIEEIVTAQNPVTREIDFQLAISPYRGFGDRDPQTEIYYQLPSCGWAVGFWGQENSGAGYGWVAGPPPPNTASCMTAATILHEWTHELEPAVEELMLEGSLYTQNTYPDCGNADPDTFLWYPNPDDPPYTSPETIRKDPDSPWCGRERSKGPGKIGQFAHDVLHHFDPSMSHYRLSYLTGNHCDNGKMDYGEDSIDRGGPCPTDGNVRPVVTIDSPTTTENYIDNVAIIFQGTATDEEDDNLVLTGNIEWTSGRDGPLGMGSPISRTLTAGRHYISAVVTDSAGDASQTVGLYIDVAASEPDPPCKGRKCK